MALRAKKPEVKEHQRFKALIYSIAGVGKTHFCCSFPNTYYIDTEGLDEYKHFVEMIRSNEGALVRLNELTEIIKEVKELMSTKHNYKTLVIDSLTFPATFLAALEAERLSVKTGKEGTEFGANQQKPKSQVFQLGVLLTRLDMNVIVVAHEKTKFEKDKEVGKIPDINDKMGHALGTVINLRSMGTSRKAFIDKSRYPQLKLGHLIDFDDGYKVIKDMFGEEIFVHDSLPEELATVDQINELKSLMELLNTPEETKQKWLINSNSSSFDQMSAVNMGKIISHIKAKNKIIFHPENGFEKQVGE